MLVLLIVEVLIGLVFYLLSLIPSTRSTNLQPVVMTFVNSPVIVPKLNSIIAFGIPELTFQSILALVVVIPVIRTWASQVKRVTNLTATIFRDGIWGVVTGSWVTGGYCSAQMVSGTRRATRCTMVLRYVLHHKQSLAAEHPFMC
ncbi:hypothetical protein Clacol_009700 [Clathrus columnatus]|uniref:Uncharacterized protein n=1 Tax=Clathrus columnatus TaxID=1419009 RepID=A0AAV5API9_9AGAM|nr:hypothetical protein Clacol_009700 [Clathrus columnatus]